MGQRILLFGASGFAQWREANRSFKVVLREIKLLTIFHSTEKKVEDKLLNGSGKNKVRCTVHSRVKALYA